MDNVGSHRGSRVEGQRKSDGITRVSQGPWLTCVSKGLSKRAGTMEEKMLLILLAEGGRHEKKCPAPPSVPSASLLCHVTTNPPEATQEDLRGRRREGLRGLRPHTVHRSATAQMKRGPGTSPSLSSS